MAEDNEDLPVISPTQSFLFEAWPEQPALVERVKRFIHTGKNAMNRPDMPDIVEAVLNGASKRAVANHFHVGRQTIDGVFELLEAANLLLPLKQRLATDWLETVRLTQWRIQEALVKGKMPLQVLGMLAGVGTDKIKDLTHSMPEEPDQKTIDVTPESIMQALLGEPKSSVKESSSDSASGEHNHNSLRDNGDYCSDTETDTDSGGQVGSGGPALDGSEEGGGVPICRGRQVAKGME